MEKGESWALPEKQGGRERVPAAPQPQPWLGADAPLPCSLCVPLPAGLHHRLHGDPPGGEWEPGPHGRRASAAARGLQGEYSWGLFLSEGLRAPPDHEVSGGQGYICGETDDDITTCVLRLERWKQSWVEFSCVGSKHLGLQNTPP